MTEELKPCPHCGGEPVASNYIAEAAVACQSCRATIIRRHAQNIDNGLKEAIAAWNTRAPVKVKPLEWIEHDDRHWALDWGYLIGSEIRGDVEWFTIYHMGNPAAPSQKTLKAAQAAADEHYARRIREALA